MLKKTPALDTNSHISPTVQGAGVTLVVDRHTEVGRMLPLQSKIGL